MWMLTIISTLWGCRCREIGPPPTDVPEVLRTEVSGNACYGDSAGTRVALDLSARSDVAGTVITPEHTITARGRRRGRRIRLGRYTLELRGQILVLDPDGEARDLKRIGCP